MAKSALASGVLAGCLVAASISGEARATVSTIHVLLDSRAVDSSVLPPASNEDDHSQDITLSTPPYVPLVSTTHAAVGSGVASSSITATFGTVSANSGSSFPFIDAAGPHYATSYAIGIVDDYGTAPVTGTTAAILAVSGGATGGPYDGDHFATAVIHYSLIDKTTGAIAHTVFDLSNPASNVLVATLPVTVGDVLETAYDLSVSTYVDSLSSISSVSSDFSHTAHFYVDTGVAGLDYVSQTGFDYAPPSAAPSGIPEPAAFGIVGLGLATIGFARRRKSV